MGVLEAEPALQPNEEVLCLAGISLHKSEEIHIIAILIRVTSHKSTYSLLMTTATQNIDEILMQSFFFPFFFLPSKIWQQICVPGILNVILLTAAQHNL